VKTPYIKTSVDQMRVICTGSLKSISPRVLRVDDYPGGLKRLFLTITERKN
jgi:hypothetical protein